MTPPRTQFQQTVAEKIRALFADEERLVAFDHVVTDGLAAEEPGTPTFVLSDAYYGALAESAGLAKSQVTIPATSLHAFAVTRARLLLHAQKIRALYPEAGPELAAKLRESLLCHLNPATMLLLFFPTLESLFDGITDPTTVEQARAPDPSEPPRDRPAAPFVPSRQGVWKDRWGADVHADLHTSPEGPYLRLDARLPNGARVTPEFTPPQVRELVFAAHRFLRTVDPGGAHAVTPRPVCGPSLPPDVLDRAAIVYNRLVTVLRTRPELDTLDAVAAAAYVPVDVASHYLGPSVAVARAKAGPAPEASAPSEGVVLGEVTDASNVTLRVVRSGDGLDKVWLQAHQNGYDVRASNDLDPFHVRAVAPCLNAEGVRVLRDVLDRALGAATPPSKGPTALPDALYLPPTNPRLTYYGTTWVRVTDAASVTQVVGPDIFQHLLGVLYVAPTEPSGVPVLRLVVQAHVGTAETFLAVDLGDPSVELLRDWILRFRGDSPASSGGAA